MAFFLLLGLDLFLFLGEGGARVSGGCLEEVDWLRLGDVRVDGGRCLSRCGWMSCVLILFSVINCLWYSAIIWLGNESIAKCFSVTKTICLS